MTCLPAELPRVALSVRQPWAWCIIHAGKDFENRDWHYTNPGLRFRGPVAIHASSGLTRDEYEDAAEWIKRTCDVTVPEARDLQRGGIVGSVIVQDIMRACTFSPWFMGPVGLALRKPVACDFIPAKGQLGFFKWQAGDAANVPEPAKWMLPSAAPAAAQQGSLL